MNKICKDCKNSFPLTEFKSRHYFRENGKSYTSHDARCNPCRLKHQTKLRHANQKRKEALNPNPTIANSSLSPEAKKFLYGA